MTFDQLTAGVKYDRLPRYMQAGARRYVEKGIRPGHFMIAVLGNKLTDAYAYADDENAAAMNEWSRWLTSDAPRGCWGSVKIVLAWIDSGGLVGLAEEPQPTIDRIDDGLAKLNAVMEAVGVSEETKTEGE